MLFFKRILESRQDDAPPERRDGRRYSVSPRFPLKATLNIVGRDELGAPLQPRNGEGWDWAAHLVNLSARGARLQLPSTINAQRGDRCLLKFDLEGYPLAVPARLAHIAERRDSLVYGLKLDLDGESVAQAYGQLLELVALGASLKPTRPAQPDESGYLVEQYAGQAGVRLSVWREYAGRTVAAFDFVLKDTRVRGLADRTGLEYLVGMETDEARPAPPMQSAEIHRLFHWVVPNLAPAVPADVREFLEKYAA